MGARFRVIVDPRYAIDLWGLGRPVEPRNIREHMDETNKAALAAYADGDRVLQLD
jgi:hypothetical protein